MASRRHPSWAPIVRRVCTGTQRVGFNKTQSVSQSRGYNKKEERDVSKGDKYYQFLRYGFKKLAWHFQGRLGEIKKRGIY